MRMRLLLGVTLCTLTLFAAEIWDDSNFLEHTLTTEIVQNHLTSYNDSHSPLPLNEFIQNYIHLKTIKLENIGEEELEELFIGLPHVTTLRRISLANVKHLTDATPIEKLPQIVWVNLSNTNISHLNFLESLNRLKILELQNCKKLTDFRKLPKVKRHLEVLNLSGTSFSDVALLFKFTALNRLNLSKTPIDKLPHPSTLSNLDELILERMPNLKNIEQLRHNNSIVKLVFNNPRMHIKPYFYYLIGTMQKLEILDLNGHVEATPGNIYEATKGSREHLRKLDLKGISNVPFSKQHDDFVEEIAIGSFDQLSKIQQQEFIEKFLKSLSFKSLIIHNLTEELLNDGDLSLLAPYLEDLGEDDTLDLRALQLLTKLVALNGEGAGGSGGFPKISTQLEGLRCDLTSLEQFVDSGYSTSEFVSLKKLRLYCRNGDETLELLHDMPALEKLSIHCGDFENHPRSFWESIQVLADKGVQLTPKIEEELAKL